jgi:hypothetical protein
MRNALVLRRFDARVMRALGVRYVVTDAPLDGGATLVMREATPLSSTHYLYEISGANRGDFSPTVVVPVASVKSTLATLADPQFDFARSVVLEAPLPVKLVAARASEVRLEAGHLRVRATSEGTSLLLLPFEFSHSLTDQIGGQIDAGFLFEFGDDPAHQPFEALHVGDYKSWFGNRRVNAAIITEGFRSRRACEAARGALSTELLGHMARAEAWTNKIRDAFHWID